MSSIVQYGPRNVFWGRELPIVGLYDSNWALIDEWRFVKADNFRMEIRAARVMDAESEMENGMIRQRVRGYRMYVDFSVNNIENRDLMIFLRKMYEASHILLTPHWGSMVNPNDDTYNFEVIMDSDFEPRYYDGRFIGHVLSWSFKSKDLLNYIPRDGFDVYIIEATTKFTAGVEEADEQTSVTYPNEKMIYGEWEVSEQDYRQIAYVEIPPSGWEDPYGEAP